MELEWDEDKRLAVFSQRGVDLLKAARMFEGRTVTTPDLRQHYGEDRFIAIGMVADECFVLVFTMRGYSMRLITAWKGGRDERERYTASQPR